MPTTAINALPYPAASDPPNVPADLGALAAAVDPKLLPRFANAAARDTAITAPTDGMIVMMLDSGLLHRYNSTAAAWRVYGTWRTTATVTSPTATVTITGIPTYLREVRVTWRARSDTAATVIGLRMRVNNDSTAAYVYSFTQQAWSVNNPLNSGGAVTSWEIGPIAGAVAGAANFGSGDLCIAGWNQTWLRNTHQAFFYEGAGSTWAQHGGGLYFAGTGGGYSRLDFFPVAGNFVAGTEFLVTGTE